MNARPGNSKSDPAAARRLRRAFTLVEIMVTMAVFSLVILGVVYSQMFGMRMYEISKAKLGASDEARAAISKLTEEVRSAAVIRVGMGDLTSFEEIPIDTLQAGNAVQIYPIADDTNSFVRYFWNETDNRFMRTTNGSSAVFVIAHSISNEVIFTSEDFQGNVLSNNYNNRVIGLTLQFYQLQYPAVPLGGDNYFDFYQLRTKIARRALE